MPGHGEIPELGGAVVARVADYHGIVDVAPGDRDAGGRSRRDRDPEPHLPGRELVDSFLVVRGGELAGTWPVDARGRNG